MVLAPHSLRIDFRKVASTKLNGLVTHCQYAERFLGLFYLYWNNSVYSENLQRCIIYEKNKARNEASNHLPKTRALTVASASS